MSGPDGVPVLDAFRVVPHAIAIDHRSPGCLGDGEHTAVDVSRYPGQHLPGRSPQACGPGLTNEIVIPDDPPGSHDDDLRVDRERPDREARTGSPPLHLDRPQDRTSDPVTPP